MERKKRTKAVRSGKTVSVLDKTGILRSPDPSKNRKVRGMLENTTVSSFAIVIGCFPGEGIQERWANERGGNVSEFRDGKLCTGNKK